MATCGKGKKHLPTSAKYCGECGQMTNSKGIVRKCDHAKYGAHGNKYCPYCGQFIGR
jgi:methionyl-tRNA synthetase